MKHPVHEILNRYTTRQSGEQQTEESLPDGSYAGRSGSITWLFHNVVIHPIAGTCWFLGWRFEALGDRLHDWHHNSAEAAEQHRVWWEKTNTQLKPPPDFKVNGCHGEQ